MCGYVKGAYAIIICNGFSKDQSRRSLYNLSMKIKSYFSPHVCNACFSIYSLPSNNVFMCLHL